MEKTESKKIYEIFDKEKYTDHKVAEWFIKEQTYDNHMLTDIKDVNYNKYATQTSLKLKPLTEPFCDNIMLFTIVPEDQIQEINKVKMYKKELCGISNTLLRYVFKKHDIKLVGQSVKCKKAIKYYAGTKDNDGFISQTRQALREIYNMPLREKKYKTKYNKENLNDAYIITYKVELADENIEELHHKLENVLEELGQLNNLFFLLDFDITKDLYNSADYRELKEHMRNYFNILEENYENDKTRYVIVDNKKNVSSTCITYNKFVDGKYVQRGKFYDKFICQITSGGVTKTIGSNVYNYLFCPDKRLRATFSDERAINAGITRAEVTIRGGTLPSLQELKDTIQEIYNIGDAPIFYKTPIQAKFRALTETLENNLIVYNKPEKALYITLWGNTLTSKTTGTIINMSRYPEIENKEKVINYVKAHYSIALLNCYYVEIEKKDEELTFKTTLIKKEYGETQLFKNNVCFTHVPKDNTDITCKTDDEEDTISEEKQEQTEEQEPDTQSKDSGEQNIINVTKFLKERGLYSEELKFFLPIKKQQIKSKLQFNFTEEEADKIPYTMSQKEREKLLERLNNEEIDEILTKIKREEKEQRIENLKMLREEIKRKHEELQEREQEKEHIKKCLFGESKSSLDLELNKTYYVVGFRVTKNDYYSIYVYEEQEEERIYGLYRAPPLVKKILQENKDSINFINCGDGIYTKISCKDYFLFFIPDKYEYKNNNKYTHVGTCKKVFGVLDNMDDLKENLEDLQKEENKHTVQELEGEYKTTQLNRLEELEENKDYTITHIKKIEYRGKTRYVFKIKENKITYLSNYFLEQELINKNIPKEHFRFRTTKFRTTATKKKEMHLVI